MTDIAVLDAPDVAAVALEPTRARLLAALAAVPGSAAQVASRLGLPRQRVGHHLRALEDKGLVVEVGTRRHGGLTERVLAASARAYVVSPAALGDAGADPARIGDRLSAAYLVAVAARAVREVGQLLRGAERAGRRLPTLTVETEIRFASAADRAAFADDLAACVRDLTARYHSEGAPGGRWYRLVAISHPRPGGAVDAAPPPSPAEEAPV
ncbi:winged helix-turn-helix domain-containing protein [Kineosporia sp. R_H_3]|uniref:winged helix-turn-helix domain-containing protein n=1 Tax=Kineosporia sp. R_H_3 TaxID=1961848 RepID=UPI000B4BC152|nr:winged helix-turn-helix domain-containing protein [Kineosporia sp. R_H_3]